MTKKRKHTHASVQRAIPMLNKKRASLYITLCEKLAPYEDVVTHGPLAERHLQQITCKTCGGTAAVLLLDENYKSEIDEWEAIEYTPINESNRTGLGKFTNVSYETKS